MMKTLPLLWTVAMEATIFSGWIYDHPLPQATQIKVALPLMLRSIAAHARNPDAQWTSGPTNRTYRGKLI